MDEATKSRQDGLIAEYKALRDEILVTYTRRTSIQNIGTALFAGLQVAAFTQSIPELCIGGTLLILAFWHDDIRWVESMARWGAYIRLVIEPQVPGLQWETMLHKVNPGLKPSSIRSRVASMSSRYPMIVLMGVGLFVAAMYHSHVRAGTLFFTDIALMVLALAWGFRLLLAFTDYGSMARRWEGKFSHLLETDELRVSD